MSIPGDERNANVEAEGTTTEIREARFNRVDVDFFRVFEVPILAGRGFEAADLATDTVVVNQPFAQKVFGGNALGRRIRYLDRGPEPGRWHEIVGIVRDFPTGVSPGMRDTEIKIYHAAAAGQLQPVMLAIRVRDGIPTSFTQRLVEMAGVIDPDMYLRDIRGLDDALRSEQWISRLTAAVFAAVTLSVLLLSSAGIYALMSFTVAQRRREIGIRIALGADRKQIVGSIFSRAFLQLGAGAALGLALGIAVERLTDGVILRGNAGVVLPAVTMVVVTVGFLAALGPTRRSLRIEPTEALREQ
jgi:hypothetical protein